MAMLDDLTCGPVDKARKHLERDARRAHKTTKEGHPVIALAARGGSVELVALLLDHGADPNAMSTRKSRPPRAISPLSEAVLHKHLDVVELLLERGAAANGVDASIRPVRLAALVGSLPMLELLRRHGANLQPDGRYQSTPLEAAASEGHVDSVAWLLDHGADVDEPSGRVGPTSALTAAAGRGHLDVVRLLLARGASVVPKAGTYPLNAAVTGHRNTDWIDIVTALTQAGADLADQPKYGLSAWHAALSFPSVLAKLLARYTVAESEAPRLLSSASGESLTLLLEAGLDANTRHLGRPVLQHCDLDKTRTLIAYGADPHAVAGGRTALTAALLFGNADVAEHLIDIGVSTQPVVDQADALLKSATEGGHEACASIIRALTHRVAPDSAAATLAERGVSVDADSAEQYIEDVEITRLLLEAGLSPNTELDESSWLGWAVVEDAEDTAMLLVEAGADTSPDLDVDGDPLCTAALQQDHSRLLAVLLGLGLSPDFDCDGDPAIEVAARQDRFSVFAVLAPKVAAVGALTPQRALNLAAATIDHSSDREPVAPHYLDVLAALVPIKTLVGPTPDGATLLHAAAYFGDVQTGRWLLSRGADPARSDRSGRTARTIAEQRRRQAFIELLDSAE